MSTKYEKQEFGEAGNISLASASGAIDGDFCEIRCIGSTTFTALVDTIERTSAEFGNKASGTITFSGLPSAGIDTITVHSLLYSLMEVQASAAEIAVGANGAETAANVAAAIAARDPLVTTSVAAGAKASGTITFTDLPVADEVFEVNSIEYTFKAEAVLATDVEIGVDVAAMAAAVAAAVAANDPLVTAAAEAGVATITAAAAGNAGNAFTLTETATNTAVSAGGTLTGGTDVVTVTARDGGTGGNAFTLTEDADNTTVSGSGTLAGGTNLVTAASLTYPDGHVLRGKFSRIHLAGGNARVTLSSSLFG